MKIAVFWVVAPCSLVVVYQRWLTSTRLHGATTQKTAIFIARYRRKMVGFELVILNFRVLIPEISNTS
jgi:hypothetical protein